MQKTAPSRTMRACLLVLAAAHESVPRKDYTAVLTCLQIALLRGHIDHTLVVAVQGPATQKFSQIEARMHDA